MVLTRDLSTYIVGKFTGARDGLLFLQDPVFMRRVGDKMVFENIDVVQDALAIRDESTNGFGVLTPKYVESYIRFLEVMQAPDPSQK